MGGKTIVVLSKKWPEARVKYRLRSGLGISNSLFLLAYQIVYAGPCVLNNNLLDQEFTLVNKINRGFKMLKQEQFNGIPYECLSDSGC